MPRRGRRHNVVLPKRDANNQFLYGAGACEPGFGTDYFDEGLAAGRLTRDEC